MKKALYLHEKVCSRNDCVTCVFYNAVKSIYYINNDLPKYNFGHHNVSDIKIIKDKCKVRFNETLDYNDDDKQQKVEINWIKIQLSTYYCCSLKEIMILNI